MTSRRTIEIGGFDAGLSLKHRQLIIRRGEAVAGQIPAEEIGLLLVDTPNTSYTHSTLVEIVSQGGVVVLCDASHLPSALVVPVNGHHLVHQRLQVQLEATEPRKKRIWQEIVRAKIRNQSAACEDDENAFRLLKLAEKVRSGDPENVEAQAAKLYWSCFLPPDHSFRRDRDGSSPNNFLNYGYAVMRAAVARSLYAAGLNPAFGVHHSNRSNAFCLADDLVEAFRPWVDLAARSILRQGTTEMTKTGKEDILSTLYTRCRSGRMASTTLQIAADRTAFALVARLSGESDQPLPLPVLENPRRSKNRALAEQILQQNSSDGEEWRETEGEDNDQPVERP